MKCARQRGFSLIELLTVIAIIAILASLIFPALSRSREKARTNRMNNAMLQIRTAMTQYYADHGTYPPGYGFVAWDTREDDPSLHPDDVYFFLKPYMAYIGMHGLADVYDEFSETAGTGYDADRDGAIGPLEFGPVGAKNIATGSYTFPTERYVGANLESEVDQQLSADRRPFIYAPVNMRQLKKARNFWISQQDWYATTWDPANPILLGVTFPPASYDAFVLIGVGPGGSSFGVAPNTPPGTEVSARDIYHLLAMRAFFLATRDLNDNGEKDFDFTARNTRGEAEMEYQVNGVSVNNQLPDPNAPDGYGPWIFVVQ